MTFKGEVFTLGYFKHPRVARDVEQEALSILRRIDKAKRRGSEAWVLARAEADWEALMEAHSRSIDAA